jgi:hypothetical protein
LVPVDRSKSRPTKDHARLRALVLGLSVFVVSSVPARDRNQARFLFSSIGNQMDKGVWRSQTQFRSSKNWALKAEGRH